jgi:hypothetical protein
MPTLGPHVGGVKRSSLQLGIVQSLRHRPGDADAGGAPQIFADCRSAHPIVTAICRSLTPRACLNLRTSRTFRIGALSAGIGPPLAWSQTRPRPRFEELQIASQAGRLQSEWEADFRRTQCRLPLDSVADFRWITQIHQRAEAPRPLPKFELCAGSWRLLRARRDATPLLRIVLSTCFARKPQS